MTIGNDRDGSAAAPVRRARAIPRWLRGSVFFSPHGTSVRLGMETNSGTRAEVYLTRKQAKQLLASLDWILNGVDRGE